MVLPIAAAIPCMFLQRRQQPRRCSRAFRKALVQEDSLQGTLTFQADSVERSLKHVGVGCIDGEHVKSEYVKKTVSIKNGRDRSFSLDKHGFTFVQDVPEIVDFYNEMDICKKYYPACCKLVQQLTGAAKVIAFYHTVRSHESIPAARKRIKMGFPVEGPASCVHVDYSSACAARQVRLLAKPPHQWPDPRPLLGFKPLIDSAEADEYLLGSTGKRWAIMNCWRNLSPEPVQRSPVALCDGSSTRLDDIVTFKVQNRSHSKEYYFSGYSEDHDWYYFPQAQRDEAIIVKNWDSAGEAFAREPREETVPTTFAFHTAFDAPNTPGDAPYRESMEVRMVVFW